MSYNVREPLVEAALKNYYKTGGPVDSLIKRLAAVKARAQQEAGKNRSAAVSRQSILDKGKAIAEKRAKDYYTESNDNAWIDYHYTQRKVTPKQLVQQKKRKNPHLEDKAKEGAAWHAAWEKEHPVLTQWGNILGAAPLVVASAPLLTSAGSGAIALGDAAAATTAGQALTSFLAPVTTSSIAGATLPQWLDVGLTSASGAHGMQTAAHEGGISPMTALEIGPLGRLVRPAGRMAAQVVEDARYPLGRPVVPEGYSTVTPTVRTRIGDVEIDNPGLNYRVGTKEIVDDFISSGKVRAGKVNSQAENKVGGVSLKRKETFGAPMFKEGSLWYQPSEEMNGLLVTDQPLVTANKNAAPVVNNGVFTIQGTTFVNDFGGRKIPAEGQVLDASNTSAYIWEPTYGYRKISPQVSYTAPFEVPASITDRFLRLVKRQGATRRPQLPPEYVERWNSMSSGQRATLRAQERMLRDSGVDMSQVDAADIMDASERWDQLLSNNPFERYTIVEPTGINGFTLFDNYATGDGVKTIGKTQLYGNNADNSLHIGYIENLTRFEPNVFGGVQERGINAAINTSNSLGLNGVISGEQYLNAPLQLHVMDKFPKKTILKGRGAYNNTKAVQDYRRKHNIASSIFDDERYVSTLEEMRNADPNVRTYLEPADAFLLNETNGFVPTKATIFNPDRINNKGEFLFDWYDPFVFKNGGNISRKGR